MAVAALLPRCSASPIALTTPWRQPSGPADRGCRSSSTGSTLQPPATPYTTPPRELRRPCRNDARARQGDNTWCSGRYVEVAAAELPSPAPGHVRATFGRTEPRDYDAGRNIWPGKRARAPIAEPECAGNRLESCCICGLWSENDGPLNYVQRLPVSQRFIDLLNMPLGALKRPADDLGGEVAPGTRKSDVACALEAASRQGHDQSDGYLYVGSTSLWWFRPIPIDEEMEEDDDTSFYILDGEAVEEDDAREPLTVHAERGSPSEARPRAARPGRDVRSGGASPPGRSDRY
jgi:hypothetical protein